MCARVNHANPTTIDPARRWRKLNAAANREGIVMNINIYMMTILWYTEFLYSK